MKHCVLFYFGVLRLADREKQMTEVYYGRFHCLPSVELLQGETRFTTGMAPSGLETPRVWNPAQGTSLTWSQLSRKWTPGR